MASPRFLVGIDLGTTHTVVAYTEITDNLENSPTHIFNIDQLIALVKLHVNRYSPLFVTTLLPVKLMNLN